MLVRVSDVYPDGRSILIIDYIRRARYRDGYEQERMLVPGQVTPVTFDVGWLSQIFAKGHRIRVTIASTGAPFYEPNPNTGEPLTIEPPARTAVATNAVWHSQNHASRIIAPLIAPAGPKAPVAAPEKSATVPPAPPAITAAAAIESPVAKGPRAPVNVLFIIADDLRC